MSTVSNRVRAVADVTEGTILAAVEIAAPPERVFRAITTDDVVHWWGSPELYQTTQWVADVQSGAYRDWVDLQYGAQRPAR